MPYQQVPASPSDIEGLFNIGIMPGDNLESQDTAAGGIAFNKQKAVASAIGEALERYAAQVISLSEEPNTNLPTLTVKDFTLFSELQRQQPNFPYNTLYEPSVPLARAYNLLTNEPVRLPSALLSLTDTFGHNLITSNGLAAGRSPAQALLRATQELIERDAFMATWLHGLPGVHVDIPKKLAQKAAQKYAKIIAVDITPVYSPMPVAMILGESPVRGRPRFSLGLACRETWNAAVEKAFLEWCQGVGFVGFMAANYKKMQKAEDAVSFEDHALFYTLNQSWWSKLPILKKAPYQGFRTDAPRFSSALQLLAFVAARLDEAGIQLYYRDLTTVDLVQIGVSAVRVVSPQLIPIHANHNWPFLGGTTPDVKWRYPHARSHNFPSPFPHPLG